MRQLFFEIYTKYKLSFQGIITSITGTSAVSFFEHMESAAKWVAPAITLLTGSILLLTLFKMFDEWLRKEFNQSLYRVVRRSIRRLIFWRARARRSRQQGNEKE